MKKLLLVLLALALPWPAEAIEGDLDRRFRTGRAMQYWGLGGGVIGGATALPLTAETLRVTEELQGGKTVLEQCVNTTIAILVLPPLYTLTGAAWLGGVGGTGVGLGGSLVARRALVEAGGKVTPAPAILGITSLVATPPLLIFGLQEQERPLIYAGIGTFAGANAMLLTQSLINGAEYQTLGGGTARNIVIPPITFSGRF